MKPIVIHRDVKPLNMLIDNNRKTIKICDFGSVRFIKGSMTAQQGTPLYMAPEVSSVHLPPQNPLSHTLSMQIVQ